MVTPGRQEMFCAVLPPVSGGIHWVCQGSSAGGEAASYGNLVDAQEPWVAGRGGRSLDSSSAVPTMWCPQAVAKLVSKPQDYYSYKYHKP